MNNKSGFFSTHDMSVLFLQEIKQLQDNGSINEIFNNIRGCNKIDIIVACAENDNDFKQLCRNPLLDKHWESIWCTYGLLLTTKNTFYAQPEVCQFDLVVGVHYYYLSLSARQKSGTKYLSAEIQLLLKSKDYHSIHATHTYQEYLLSNISEDNNEAVGQFEGMINDIYKLIKYYGSYTYMMLADIFLQYLTWCTEKNYSEKTNQLLAKAIEACKHATSCLNQSRYAIDNASLFLGLASSNSYGMETPEKMLELIKTRKDFKLQPPPAL